MTLRARLLMSALLLSLATTITLALVVRDAWQKAEAAQFDEQFERAVTDLSTELGHAAAQIKEELLPLCAHEPSIDSALIGTQSGTLSSRLLSIRARIPSLKAALSLDELALITDDGTVIGGEFGGGSYSSGDLTRVAQVRSVRPGFQPNPERAFVAACVKEEDGAWVALIGARHLDPLLAKASSPEFSLAVAQASQGEHSSKESRGVLLSRVRVDFLDGAEIQASRSRLPLIASLKHLDLRVLMASSGALLFGLLLAFFLSKGLARPVVAFAEKTRDAVTGTVEALPIEGGPELEQAARAFNATLDDLKALRERLRATERIAARREVARRIAHEIKNPLSPIRTSIETLRKLKERKHAEFDSYFDETTLTVLSEVKRISQLVSSFAEYARLPSPEPEPLDLGELAARIVGLHQKLGATITLEQEPLPEILADRDQISQVITNLLKNAIEATFVTDSPCIEVKLRKAAHSLNKAHAKVELSVSDNGPGVSAEGLVRLFEPYGTTKEDGTGLGLPISQRIAIEHGGDLTYTTRPGGGARFILHLPTSGPPQLEGDEKARS